MEEEAIPLDRLVKIYRKLRTRMTELTQAYDTQAEVLKAQQDEIKNNKEKTRRDQRHNGEIRKGM